MKPDDEELDIGLAEHARKRIPQLEALLAERDKRIADLEQEIRWLKLARKSESGFNYMGKE